MPLGTEPIVSIVYSPQDMSDMCDDPVLVEHVDDDRWTKTERVICYQNRNFYAITRVSGLTEYQELEVDDQFPEQPKRVRPVNITATVWQEVKNQ